MGASGRGKRYRKYLCVYVRLLAYYIHITRARAHTKYIISSHTIYISSHTQHAEQHNKHTTTCTPTHKHKYIHTYDSGALYGRGSLCVCLRNTLSHSMLYSFTLPRSLSLSLWFSLSIWLARSLALSCSLALSHTHTCCSSATPALALALFHTHTLTAEGYPLTILIFILLRPGGLRGRAVPTATHL